MSHYIAPYDSNLYYAICCFYYFSITSSYNAQFSLTIKYRTYLGAILLLYAPMTTYLKDLIQSIGRYGGHSWQEIGFKDFWMHKYYLYLVRIFGQQKILGKHHMLDDP